MIGPVEVLLAAVLFLLGWALAVSALRALAPYRRLRRVPSCPVAQLAPGPAMVAGTLRAVDAPLTTVDGQTAAALRTRISYTYRRDDEGYRMPDALDRLTLARVELTDRSGTCVVEPGALVLLGPEVRLTFAGADFIRDFPALWAACKKTDPGVVLEEAMVTQRFVPDGATGFVAGEAVREESAGHGEVYRDAPQRWRIRGTSQRALMLSARPEAEVARYLARPPILLAWAAALCWATAAALLLAAQSLTSLAAPP